MKIQRACRREVKEFKSVEKKILTSMPPVASTEELPYVSLNVSENKHLYSNLSKQNQKIEKIMESRTEKIVKKM